MVLHSAGSSTGTELALTVFAADGTPLASFPHPTLGTFAYGCALITDLDLDGNPEVVLLERGYEYQTLRIFTLTDTGAVARWSGLGYSI